MRTYMVTIGYRTAERWRTARRIVRALSSRDALSSARIWHDDREVCTASVRRVH